MNQPTDDLSALLARSRALAIATKRTEGIRGRVAPPGQRISESGRIADEAVAEATAQSSREGEYGRYRVLADATDAHALTRLTKVMEGQANVG